VFNWTSANLWFSKYADGEAYDWLGLLCFTLAVKRGSPDKMFCSEFGVRLMRAGGSSMFDPNWDADRTAPIDFAVVGGKDLIWDDGRIV
jgi:hypothetical protein